MRAAPSVVVDLPGSRRWALALAALGAAAAAGAAAALLAHLQPFHGAVTVAVGPLLAAAAGALAAWRWAPHDHGRLAWDGARWQLDGASGRLSVMIDLGGWMLLCFAPADGRRRWLPVSDARVPQALGLRAAVYCRPLPDPHLPGRPPE